MKDEVQISATSGGRLMTLDPILDQPPINLPIRRVETTIPCGLRVEWISGNVVRPDGKVYEFSLDSGAGCGSKYLTLSVKGPDGEHFANECVDMAEVLEAWVDRVLETGRSPERAP